MVALLPAALLQTRFQPVPPHCTVADAWKPCCHCSPAAWLFLEAAERHLHWQNPAKLWSPTAQRHLWVCWKVWHYPLKWNIFEALVISKALIPKLMWENMSLPQNFLVTWTDGFLSQEINLFLCILTELVNGSAFGNAYKLHLFYYTNATNWVVCALKDGLNCFKDTRMLLLNLLFLCSVIIRQHLSLSEKRVTFQISIWSFVIRRGFFHSI